MSETRWYRDRHIAWEYPPYVDPAEGMEAVAVVPLAEWEAAQRLREALVIAAIPLEALHATERGGIALSKTVQDAIESAVRAIRAALRARGGVK